MRSNRAIFFGLLLAFALSGCERISDRLGLEDPAKRAARRDVEGQAVGGGCRQSGRAIEDCYAIYAWLPMESIYAGWREMDEYMRTNKLETTTPVLPPIQDPSRKKRPTLKPDSSPEAETASTPNGAAEAVGAEQGASPEVVPETAASDAATPAAPASP